MADGAPLVSVVTRTIGQPAFLARAADCLGRAAPPGTQWVLVDDSGADAPAVGAAAEAARGAPNLAVTIVPSGQRHRARALNAGLAAAAGTYVHILDDDDTVAAGFYEAAIAALDKRPALGAVAVRAERVDEEVRPDGTLRELARRPHHPELRAVTIAGMAVRQLTPPCSLLFRAAAMRATGAFDPELAVCEDHEFLLRFLLRSDIALIDRALCAFHVRGDRAPEGFRNSAATLGHAEADAFFRNAMLRRSLRDAADPIGLLLAAGELARGAVNLDRTLSALAATRAAGWLRRLRK